MSQAVINRLNANWSGARDREISQRYHHLLGSPLSVIEVTAQVGSLYIGDFYGLLTYLGITQPKWFTYLIQSGFKSSTEYDGSPLTLFTYDDEMYTSIVKQEIYT